jgi:hypothetical protein
VDRHARVPRFNISHEGGTWVCATTKNFDAMRLRILLMEQKKFFVAEDN